MVERAATDESTRTLKTVMRAFDIIDGLKELNGAGVTELANHLGMSKSTVYNYITTLRQKGYIVKRDDSYELSFQFLFLGEFVRNQDVLYANAKPEVEKLASDTGEYVHLITEQHGLAVNIYKARGESAVGSEYQTELLQKPDYLHYSASGKSILAHLPDSRVEEIIQQHGLNRRTVNTITDKDELFEELEITRERGYATNNEEEVEGLRAIGAPIKDRHDSVLGSISVSGPVSRISEEYDDSLIDKIINTANVIEVNINMAETT